MKERKETINLVTANVFSLAVLALSAIVFFGAFIALWGGESIYSPDKVEEQVQAMSLGTIFMLVAIIAGIVVHELIHGLVWGIYAPSRFKSISFGVIWKMLTPYCHCSEPMKVKNYMKGALAPLVVLGIIVLVFMVIALKNLNSVLKNTNQVLSDAQEITAIAARRANDVDGLVDKVSEAGINIADAVNGNQNTIKAITVLINSIASLKNLFTEKGE